MRLSLTSFVGRLLGRLVARLQTPLAAVPSPTPGLDLARVAAPWAGAWTPPPRIVPSMPPPRAAARAPEPPPSTAPGRVAAAPPRAAAPADDDAPEVLFFLRRKRLYCRPRRRIEPDALFVSYRAVLQEMGAVYFGEPYRCYELPQGALGPLAHALAKVGLRLVPEAAVPTDLGGLTEAQWIALAHLHRLAVRETPDGPLVLRGYTTSKLQFSMGFAGDGGYVRKLLRVLEHKGRITRTGSDGPDRCIVVVPTAADVFPQPARIARSGRSGSGDPDRPVPAIRDLTSLTSQSDVINADSGSVPGGEAVPRPAAAPGPQVDPWPAADLARLQAEVPPDQWALLAEKGLIPLAVAYGPSLVLDAWYLLGDLRSKKNFQPQSVEAVITDIIKRPAKYRFAPGYRHSRKAAPPVSSPPPPVAPAPPPPPVPAPRPAGPPVWQAVVEGLQGLAAVLAATQVECQTAQDGVLRLGATALARDHLQRHERQLGDLAATAAGGGPPWRVEWSHLPLAEEVSHAA